MNYLCAAVFCICLIQAIHSNPVYKESSQIERIRNNLNSLLYINERFERDVNAIIDEYSNNPFILLVLDNFMSVLAKDLQGSNMKINVCALKSFTRDEPEEYLLGTVDIVESVFNQTSRSESTDNLLRLIRATRASAPYQEIEKVLEYVYGSPENQPQAIPFNELVPMKRDCTSDITEKLKRVPGLRPKVLEDFQNTTQQFCFDGSFIVIFLRGVARRIAEVSEENGGTIDEETLKAYTKDRKESIIDLDNGISMVEDMMPTEEAFQTVTGILDVAQAFRMTANKDEIDLALEYLLDASVNKKNIEELERKKNIKARKRRSNTYATIVIILLLFALV